ncbi:MAG: ATP-binding protein [Steroidobacter sp.]
MTSVSVNTSAAHRDAVAAYGKNRLIIDQVTMLCRFAAIPLIGTAFIGAVLGWLMLDDYPVAAVAGWYAAILTLSCVRAQAGRRFLKRRQRTVMDARRCARVMLAGAAASGLMWAVATIWLMPQDPTRQMIVGFFFIAAVSSGVGTLSPVRFAYAAMLIPFLAPFAVHQFMLGGDRVVLGAGAALFMIVMLHISRIYRLGVQEIFQLRIANETLATRLSGEKDQIEDTNADLKRQIAERERIETQLIAAKTDAEAANRAKSQFLANMSHEVRTPMNAMLGMTELLMRTPLDVKQRRFAQVAFDSGQRLLRLIDDILDLSRVEAGKLKFGCIEFPPRMVLQEVIELMAPQSAAKGLELRQHVGSDVPHCVRGDPDRLRQVLVNLLSNAIKFTERGAVTVDLCASPEETSDSAVPTAVRLRWTVNDTGVGVPADAQQQLFQPFSQADDSTTRRYGGSGLGLAISRQVIEAMNGRIGFQSQPASGSSFWFELPVEIAEPTLRGKTRDRAPPPTDLTGRVLVVEDHAVNRELLQEMLTMLGLAVRVAENGAQALAFMDREAFDLVLMDWHMPDIDGLEAARRIRAREAMRPHVIPSRIIALTASAMPGDRETCLASGMDDYIPKPFTHEEIIAALQRWLPAPATRVA